MPVFQNKNRISEAVNLKLNKHICTVVILNAFENCHAVFYLNNRDNFSILNLVTLESCLTSFFITLNLLLSTSLNWF